MAASIIPNSNLTLKNVGVNKTRTGIIDVLLNMGADIKVVNERMSGKEPMADLIVKSAKLKGTSFGAEIMPRLIDEIPVIAVAAMFAEGKTIITGAEELRVKETDRLSAVVNEFSKMGGNIVGTEDGLIIEGTGKLNKANCYSYHDHRIAMALAVAGAAAEGVNIENPDCVCISYPTFYQTLEKIKCN